MNAFQESGPRGVETRPPQLFSLAFAVGVICFPGGVQPPQPPRQFLPFFPGVCSGGYLFSRGGPTPTTPPPIFTLVTHYHRPLAWYSMRRSVNYSSRQEDKTREITLNTLSNIHFLPRDAMD